MAKRKPKRNPNSNHLAGMKCPKCGDFGPFKIDVVINTTAVISDEGTEWDGGDTEWGQESGCECMECAHKATVAEFTEK